MTPGRITSRHPVPSAGWGIHNNKAILLMECAGSVQAKISMTIEWNRELGTSACRTVAKHFRGTRWFNRCVGCGRGRYARRYAKPLAPGALLACR